MTIYLYIRLSSADDNLKYKSESESVSHQRVLLHQYVASRREFNGAAIEEFVDDGYSGTNDDRPSFERMIEKLKKGEAKTVICKDFSRFFRDYTEIGDYLERIFPFLGVRFISVNDKYDSDDYKGTTAGMEVVMKYIIYAYYSKDLSIKIKTVMNARKKRGEFVAAIPPYGYIRDPMDKKHLLPDPESSVVVRHIFDMAIEGKRPSEIARELNENGVETPAAYFRRKSPDSNKFRNMSPENCWNYFNVTTILERLEYTGAMVSQKKLWKGIDNPRTTKKDKKDWIIVPNCHEGIISEDEYNTVQSTLHHNHYSGYGRHDYPLRSLVHCGACGRAMSRSHTKRIYFRCNKSDCASETACPVGEKFYQDELETAVINSLRGILMLLLEKTTQMQTALCKTKGSCDNLRQMLAQIDKGIKQNNLARITGYEQYSDGKISRDDFLSLKDRLADDSAKLNEKRAELGASLATLEASDDSELTKFGKEADRFLKSGDVTNQMLLYFIERVDVYSGMRIEIKYRFSDEIMKILTNSENMQ